MQAETTTTNPGSSRLSTFNQFVSPAPITRKEIALNNLQIERIYYGKKGYQKFVAVAEKTSGTALGSILKKEKDCRTPPNLWMSKVGLPSGQLRNDPNSVLTRTKKGMNLDAIQEKVAVDLYGQLGINLFFVPKTRLGTFDIIDQYTMNNVLAQVLVQQGIKSSLRVLSRFVKDYQDFTFARTLSETQEEISFMDYIKLYHRPPDFLLTPTPDIRLVPLKGFMGLVAVGRLMADTDFIGGRGGNAGFRWVKDANGVIRDAETVKIDAGFAFQFDHDESGSTNQFLNTQYELPGPKLKDLKDIQIANCNSEVTILWKDLTEIQKKSFLATLVNSTRYLSDDILSFLFYRDGRFNRSEIESMPKEVADELAEKMKIWANLQLETYVDEIAEFHQDYPEVQLKINYMDLHGQLPLPMSEETYPIRELFTSLAIIPSREQQEKENQAFVAQNFGNQTETDSLRETWNRIQAVARPVGIEQLFDHGNHVLLLGRAGIGKSTLCEKIAHDWSSGRLFQDRFQGIFWLALRSLNPLVIAEGSLNGIINPDQFLARAIALVIYNDPSMEGKILSFIKNEWSHMLVILDGFDEATPELSKALQAILSKGELPILMTSRPGVTDSVLMHFNHVVENMGFDDQGIQIYSDYFFNRQIRNEESEFRTAGFMNAIQDNPNLFAIAHIPLQLQMLCSLWEQGAETGGFPLDVTALYRTMIDQLFRWECKRKGVDPLSVSGETLKELRSKLGTIAEIGLMKGFLMIPQSDVMAVLESTPFSEKNLIETGLLKKAGTGINAYYYFLHLTYQEYLCAYRVSLQPIEEQRAFIQETRDKANYALVIAFLAGIISQKDHSRTKSKTEDFFRALCENVSLSDGLPDVGFVELLLRCINECKGLNSDVRAIREFVDNYPTTLTLKLSNGLVPIHSVAQQGQMNALIWLVGSYPDLIENLSANQSTILHTAAAAGRLEVIKWINANHSALMTKLNAKEEYPLHLAAKGGHLSSVKYLIEQLPDQIEIAEDRGRTPLHLATMERRIGVMEFLLERRANPFNVGSNKGQKQNSFHWCAQYGNGEMLNLLFRFCPNRTALKTGLNQKDISGHTPLHLALKQPQLVEALIANGSEVNTAAELDNGGYSPLHWAVKQGIFESVRILVNHGAEIYALDANGETPLDLALAGWHKEIPYFLISPALHHDIDESNENADELDNSVDFHQAAYEAAIQSHNYMGQIYHLQKMSRLSFFQNDLERVSHLIGRMQSIANEQNFDARYQQYLSRRLDLVNQKLRGPAEEDHSGVPSKKNGCIIV